MTLLLLDTPSLWYRAYYGFPATLVSPTGMQVNAIKGYLDMTAKLIKQYEPNRIVACLDGKGLPGFRTSLFPEYKINRTREKPETLSPQIPVILELIKLFSIPLVSVDDYEADDILASYAQQYSGPTRIVTGDRDLFQSVDDERDVKVAYLANGFFQHSLVDYDYIATKYGIPGERYALFSLLRGDSSDGLPGVQGIGVKGAALIVNNFASLEDAVSAALEGNLLLPASLAKKIIAGADYIKIAPKVVHVARDVMLPTININLPSAPTVGNNLSAIYELKKQYDLGTSIDRLISVLN